MGSYQDISEITASGYMVFLQKEQDIDQLWAGTRSVCKKGTELGIFPCEEHGGNDGRVGRMHRGGNESQVSYAWKGVFVKYPVKCPGKGDSAGYQELGTTSVHLWLM